MTKIRKKIFAILEKADRNKTTYNSDANSNTVTKKKTNKQP